MPPLPKIYSTIPNTPVTATIEDEDGYYAGCPPYYTDAEEMEKRINEYFDLCDEGQQITRWNPKKKEAETLIRQVPYTVPGICNYLGFDHRNALRDYGMKPAFSSTIARARQRIEQQRVELALLGEHDARFSMFDLTNNFGYKAEQDIIVTPIQRRTYTAIEEQALRAQAIADAKAELEKQQQIEHITDIAPND